MINSRPSGTADQPNGAKPPFATLSILVRPGAGNEGIAPTMIKTPKPKKAQTVTTLMIANQNSNSP